MFRKKSICYKKFRLWIENKSDDVQSRLKYSNFKENVVKHKNGYTHQISLKNGFNVQAQPCTRKNPVCVFTYNDDAEDSVQSDVDNEIESAHQTTVHTDHYQDTDLRPEQEDVLADEEAKLQNHFQLVASPVNHYHGMLGFEDDYHYQETDEPQTQSVEQYQAKCCANVSDNVIQALSGITKPLRNGCTPTDLSIHPMYDVFYDIDDPNGCTPTGLVDVDPSYCAMYEFFDQTQFLPLEYVPSEHTTPKIGNKRPREDNSKVVEYEASPQPRKRRRRKNGSTRNATAQKSKSMEVLPKMKRGRPRSTVKNKLYIDKTDITTPICLLENREYKDLSHLGRKLFPCCYGCGYTSIREHDTKKHEDRSRPKKFVCDFCERKFVQKSQQNVHIKKCIKNPFNIQKNKQK